MNLAPDYQTSDAHEAAGCPVCGARQHALVFRHDTFDISRCNVCTHVFVSGGLDSAVLAAAYEENYYSAKGADGSSGYRDYVGDTDRRLKGFAYRLSALERVTIQRGRLLDFGCAIGLFVKVARDAGWDACGYERSSWAAEYGRTTYGLALESGPEPRCMADGQRYDAITMWDVLEHLESPLSIVRQLATHVRPGGLLALNTVNIGSVGARLAGERWRHIAPPFHLHYFTRQSLSRFLQEAGLRAIAWKAHGVFRWADPKRQKADGNRSRIEDLVTHWRFASIANALDLLDEVEVVARRSPA